MQILNMRHSYDKKRLIYQNQASLNIFCETIILYNQKYYC